MTAPALTTRLCADCLFQNFWQADGMILTDGICLHPMRASSRTEDERRRWTVTEQAFPSLRQRCGPAGSNWTGRPRFLTILKADRSSK